MREASSAKVTSLTPFQHRCEGRDFSALRGDLPLGDHRLALVRDGGKEVDGRLLAGAAATYGLAVDGHTHQLRGAFVGRVTRVPSRPGVPASSRVSPSRRDSRRPRVVAGGGASPLDDQSSK
jgi:hypothetical protein